MKQLTLRLLSAPEVQLDGVTLEVGLKPTVLLALLALTGGEQAHTRDQLALWLWPDKPNPLGNLSTALNKLRELIDPNLFASDERKRTIWLTQEIDCDAVRVIRLCDRQDSNAWAQAWTNWPEGFMPFPDPRWDARFDPSFQTWLEEKREFHRLKRRALAVKLAQHHLERREWMVAAPYLEAIPPEIDDPHDQLCFYAMLVFTALGQPERAMRLYQQLSDVLEELGSKPSQDAQTARQMALEVAVAAARGLLEESFQVLDGADMPFVGRDPELKSLSGGLPASLEGHAWVIVITGEPGAGKTEFARKLMQHLDPTQKAYLRAEGFSERLTPAWRSFDLVVRQLVRSRRHDLESMGTELRAALARFVPDLLESINDAAPAEDERLLLLAIRWLLTHDDRPTLLFLDDLQWMDSPSLGLVLELLRKAPPRGLLLIGTQRDTEPDATDLTRLFEVIARERIGMRHALQPLQVNAIQELARSLGRDNANSVWMREQSGGNPLYLLEMFDAAYLEPGSLPPRLEQLIQARIELLGAHGSVREVLEACAVLGEGATLNEVRTVSGLDFEATVNALTNLREVRLLNRADVQIAFNHELTVAVTRTLIPPERVQLLNLRAAHVRLNRPELAATHYWLALNEGLDTLAPEAMQEVVDVFSKAGMVQSLRGDVQGGALWFDRTFEYAPNANAQVMALTRRARSHERMLRYDDAVADLKQAALLSNAVDPVLRARVLNAQSMLFTNFFGEPQKAEEKASQALRELEELDDREAMVERANALNYLGVAAWQQHKLAEAENFHRDSLLLRKAISDSEGVGVSLHNIGLVFTSARKPDARGYFEQAINMFERIGNRAQKAHVLTNLGWLEWQMGDLIMSEDLFKQALEAGKPWGDDFNSQFIYNNLGAVRFLQGKYWEARSAYRNALVSKHVKQHQHNLLIFHGNLAEVGLRLRLLDEVKEHLNETEILLAKAPNPAFDADRLYSQGEWFVLQGDLTSAIVCFDQAIIIARQSDRSEREAESMARLSRLTSQPELAHLAVQKFDSPVMRASYFVAESDAPKALPAIHALTDVYERARLLMDLGAITGNEIWRQEADALLDELHNANQNPFN